MAGELPEPQGKPGEQSAATLALLGVRTDLPAEFMLAVASMLRRLDELERKVQELS